MSCRKDPDKVKRPLVDLPTVCGIPYRRLHQAVVDGRIPAERRGSRWFASEHDVRRAIGAGALRTK
jgi:hypothetical protein